MLLLLFILLVIAAIVVDRSAKASQKRRYALIKEDTAVCGNCGYTAMLHETDRCPECGELYAHAGVYTQALETRLGPPFALTATTSVLGALLLGVLLAGLTWGIIGGIGTGSNIEAGSIATFVGLLPLFFTIVTIIGKRKKRRELLAPRTPTDA